MKLRVYTFCASLITFFWLSGAWYIAGKPTFGLIEHSQASKNATVNLLVQKQESKNKQKPDNPKVLEDSAIKLLTLDQLNQWGGYFSGVFAPISLIWICLAFFAQREQLSRASDAINLQNKALEIQGKSLLQQHDEQLLAAKVAAMTALIEHEWSQHAVFTALSTLAKNNKQIDDATANLNKAINASERARKHAAELRVVLRLE